MASRIASLRTILPELESALRLFTSSPSKFRVVRTVNPTNTQPRTLYILDSSFNPPSIAHLALATSAISNPAPSDSQPHRLLLLFSTHNADKAPSPASFVQRLALMTIFAEDLSRSLQPSTQSLGGSLGTSLPAVEQISPANISIDIGLTKEPYYTDKSIAIVSTEPLSYPSNPVHVHLVGYDTLIRFCAAKYYPNHNPPLSALAPFFSAGHKLRVTQRPFDPSDRSSSQFGTVEEQAVYLQNLRDGGFEKEGFEKAWGNQIDMVAGDDGVGVSSTRIRNAAKAGDWDVVKQLCTEGVATWVREMALYDEDASGAKMA
ncbi:Nucleotidylyl transferase [Zopfia rhizophila CBS 207.26]|uniref:Nucleotidylyl transferase n=1 Tax=Zopfia rhizophila CBS 207.26 TaxID=1314779 RepID=A0A6A6DY81_9PEZI|nr:Nucleotidylyl transferase [Zopfia rhizophila CBS 207.26]